MRVPVRQDWRSIGTGGYRMNLNDQHRSLIVMPHEWWIYFANLEQIGVSPVVSVASVEIVVYHNVMWCDVNRP